MYVHLQMSPGKLPPVRLLKFSEVLRLDDEYLNGEHCEEDCVQDEPNHFFVATLRNNIGIYRGWRQQLERKLRDGQTQREGREMGEVNSRGRQSM